MQKLRLVSQSLRYPGARGGRTPVKSKPGRSWTPNGGGWERECSTCTEKATVLLIESRERRIEYRGICRDCLQEELDASKEHHEPPVVYFDLDDVDRVLTPLYLAGRLEGKW